MMNPFKKPSVSLTSDAYRRWLRAHSPQPLAFFLGLDEVEQETLAGLGEEYDEDSYIAQSYAMRDPDAAAFGATAEGLDGDGDELEESLVHRMSQTIATRMAQVAQEGPGSTPVRTAPSMGGITERRAAGEREAQTAHNEGRRLMGRAPDEVTA